MSTHLATTPTPTIATGTDMKVISIGRCGLRGWRGVVEAERESNRERDCEQMRITAIMATCEMSIPRDLCITQRVKPGRGEKRRKSGVPSIGPAFGTGVNEHFKPFLTMDWQLTVTVVVMLRSHSVNTART